MNRHLTVFILFTAAYFMSYFFRSANAVIAPDLVREMQLTAADLGLMTSLFFATFAAVQTPLGVGLDRWGPRWVTPILMLVGVIGALIFAVAPSFPVLALGRALIGMGMAGVLMGSLTIFSQWFSAQRFATVSGLLVGIGALGSLAAATPLAWLTAQIGWRLIFGIGALLTALFAGAIMLWTRNTPPGVPWRGNSTSEGTLLTVFRTRQIWHIIPLIFFLAGGLMGFHGLWAGPYLFDVYGLSPIAGGNILLWLGVGVTVGYGASGWLADQFGLGRILAIGGLLFTLSQFGLAFRPALPVVVVLYVIFGITGGFNVMLMAQARQFFPLHMTGKAVTAVNTFGIGGTFILQWLMGVIINRFPADSAGHYPPQAYTTALLVTATGSLLAYLWYLPLIQIKQSTTPPVSQ
ncbi:MAG: MFS transporter [Caldilineaceae bacterium]